MNELCSDPIEKLEKWEELGDFGHIKDLVQAEREGD